MLLQQLNRGDAEKVFIMVQNVSGVTTTQGAMACFAILPATASLGNAVATPATSNLPLFCGVFDADLASDAYGLAQVYGYRASVVVNVGGQSQSAAGGRIGPANASWTGQTNGLTFALGPVVIIDNDLSGSGWARGFIRAL